MRLNALTIFGLLFFITGCQEPSEMIITVSKSWTELPYSEPSQKIIVQTSIKVSDVLWRKKNGSWTAYEGRYTYTPIGANAVRAIEANASGQTYYNLTDADKGKIIGVVIAKIAIIAWLISRTRKKKKANITENEVKKQKVDSGLAERELIKKKSPSTETSEKSKKEEVVTPDDTDLLNPLFAATPTPKKPQSELVEQQHQTSGIAAEIESFADLRNKGILTEEEFQKKKKQLLDMEYEV